MKPDVSENMKLVVASSSNIKLIPANCGHEMVKMMQHVFPIVMEFQIAVLSNYGFIGREGLVNFEQIIRSVHVYQL